MFNKVIIPSPLRKKLMFCVFIVAIILVAVLLVDITVYNGMKTSLNGNSSVTQGVINDIGYEGANVTTLTLQDGTCFNVVSLADYAQRKLGYDTDKFAEVIQSLYGKTVDLYTPSDYRNKPTNEWLFGIADGENVVFDFDEVVTTMRQDDHTTVVICTVIVCVLATAIAVLILWKINAKEIKECELAQQYALFFADRQPSVKHKIESRLFIWLIVWVALSLIALGLITDSNLSDGWEIALTIADLVLEFGTLFVGLWLMERAIWKKDVEMYSEKFPFDFCDISHLRIKQQQKDEITAQLRERHDKFPHRHIDGGNGYETEFTPTGCILRVDPELVIHENPTISQNELEQITSKEIQIPYDKLNFEAVPIIRKKNHPLMIVIKSRLDPDEYKTDEMRNDLHFLYDINLQTTLQTFSVHVEGLQNILDNKKDLMLNCERKTK